MGAIRVYIWALGLLIGGGVVLAMGGHKMMIAVSNSSPTSMKYSQWIAEQPAAEWLELEEVFLNWEASARIDTQHTRKGVVTSTTKEYFVAGWASVDDQGPIKCFFVVQDSGKQAFMEQVWAAQDRNDEKWLEQNAPKLYEKTVVRGLTRTGFDLDSEDEKILRGLGNTAPTFRIIDIDKTPESGKGILLILGGIALMLGGGALGFFTYRSGKKTGVTLPQHTHQGRHPGAPLQQPYGQTGPQQPIPPAPPAQGGYSAGPQYPAPMAPAQPPQRPGPRPITRPGTQGPGRMPPRPPA
ncbi:MAG: hypothetical protein IPP14_02490 [Planctomycetes bacterium]|nr:hypothetical protein [Planctomycetota bacterium]